MGWNLVAPADDMKLFENLGGSKHFAFAHSYYADVIDPAASVAYTEYGLNISASVEKGNIFGCQFHPEKSGNDGLTILRNFERICEGKNS